MEERGVKARVSGHYDANASPISGIWSKTEDVSTQNDLKNDLASSWINFHGLFDQLGQHRFRISHSAHRQHLLDEQECARLRM